MIPLSILDLSPVSAGSTGAQALHNSLDLARHADALGFTRYWVAEHHNMPAIASSAPDIMIGQIAAVTKNMRIGSGGVMLPNHAPLMVAERFKVLEALFPGRIDLGLGRPPGTAAATPYAVRRRQGRLSLLGQGGLAVPEALANAWRHGLTSLSEGLDGAAEFVSGKGRHGS